MKTFFAGTQFGSFAALSKAAEAHNCKAERLKKGSQKVIIHYESIETLSQIIFSAAQFETRNPQQLQL